MKFLSVCSGIEAASCAWDWEAVAFSEIEKFPSQVLSHHYPETPNWGDMTKFKEWPDANVDVLVGGTPCQSFSVAGLRKGLDDPRGNLMLTYLAIAAKYRPKWVVWENVPGVLSSNGGLDFASFLRGLGECGYGFAYRVLDAQYFGVAQRRRRVFVVGCLGDWRSAAAVLFEQHSLQGHSAPSRKTGKNLAKCLTTSTQRYDTETETMIPWPTEMTTVQTLRTRRPGEGGMSHDHEHLVPTLSPALNTCSGANHAPDTKAYVVQPIAYNITFCDANGTRADRPNGGLYVSETDVTSTLTKAGIGTNVAQPIGTDLYNGNITGDIACTMGTPGSSVNASGPTVMQSMAVCLGGQHPNAGIGIDQSPTLTNAMGAGGGHIPITNAMQVRRLTPVECERLQGFPDGYTDIKLKGKSTPDGPRYKALGNSMAVPVMRWIGQRIEAVDRIK